MTAVEAPVSVPATARSVPHSGWLVVAGKEFADHVLSVRFFVLLAVLGWEAQPKRGHPPPIPPAVQQPTS